MSTTLHNPVQKPRILLLQPRFGEWERIEGEMLPLGLLHTARAIPSDFAVQILDHRLHGAEWTSVLRRALDPPPLLVGLTATIGTSIGDSLASAAIVRQKCPQVPLVWGGVAASALPDVALQDPLVDAVVDGPGEVTLPAIAQALLAGTPLAQVTGLFVRNALGQVVSTGPRPPIDRPSLPPLPYHLLDMPRYLARYRGGGWLPLHTSFGCPCDCTFCYSPGLFGRRWRPDSAERVLGEVREAIQRFGVRKFQFLDDNFFADRRRAMAIVQGLAPLGVQWMAHGLTILDAKRLSDVDIAQIIASGCIELGTGIESGSDRTLQRIHKGHTRAEVIAVNRRLGQHKLVVTYGMVAGFPGETAEDLSQTIDLAQVLLRDNPLADVKHILPLFPLPGSHLWQEALDLGFVPPPTWRAWAGYEATTAQVPWLTERQRRQLEGLFLCSVFMKPGKLQHHGVGGLLPWLADTLYSPLAKWRIEHRYFDAMLELHIKRAVEKLVRLRVL